MKKERIIALMLTLMMCLSLMPTNIVEAKAKAKLNKTSITLAVGTSKTIKLKNAPKLSKKKIKKVKWSSSNKKVATVKYSGKYRQNAKITAKSSGTATIKVRFNGKKYTCKVVVKDITSNTNKPVVTEEPTNTPSTTENPSTTEKNTTEHIHQYSDWKVMTAATCVSNGIESRSCSCGDVETKVITALGHSYDSCTVTKEATCTETGELTYVCTRCSESKTEHINITEHNFDDGVVQIIPTYVSGVKKYKSIKIYTCKDCGFKKSKILSES